MRILSEEEVQKRLAESVRKINRSEKNKASDTEIAKAKAEKAVWERMLYHIKNGEIITLDDEDRLQWHYDATTA
jgi:hypothetical protein